MIIIGIILTVLGIVVLQWSARAMSEPFYNRPLIFHKTVPVLIINLLWIGLLVGGLYSFWQVSYKIVIFLVGGFALLWVANYFLSSHKNRAKKFFRIYKQLKIYRPQAEEKDILRETARLYLQNLRWDQEKVEHTLKFIFDEKESKVENPKDLLNLIFIFENPRDDFSANFNFEKYRKEANKKDAAIEWAYKKVFAEKNKVTERPVLSKETVERMKLLGLDPGEMSDEQLAALEGMDNVSKSNWLSKLFSYGSIIFGLGAVISLLTLDFGPFVFSGVISILLMFIGFKIQSRVSNRKFYEASILKWAKDQEAKTNK